VKVDICGDRDVFRMKELDWQIIGGVGDIFEGI
jgi:hypothetical protein